MKATETENGKNAFHMVFRYGTLYP